MTPEQKSCIDQFWQSYLNTLPSDHPTRTQTYVAEPFGDSAELADQLGQLVLRGVKTATCSALWEWQAANETLPSVGLHSIVLNGKNDPLCIIETTEVNIRNYNEVDAVFAAEEGEGDRTLDYWRKAHWNFFSRTLPKIGREAVLDMPLVCERFRLVFAPSKDRKPN